MSPPAGGLETKHYILAALTATLIAAAVVTVVFIVLSPARIGFSVTEARHQQLAGDAVKLILTINASNPSRRAAVMYKSMDVDVSNNTGPQWLNWISANVTTGMPLHQPTRNDRTEIKATVLLVGGPGTEDFTGNMRSHAFRVKVTAVAQFKVGISWTRLYDIKVSCGPLDFFADHSSAAGCQPA
ncbi:hypothetical protein BAE44_0006272 [Dichanthelium oligosanthes]|uniref:Late embryogenesis abundant protein LEA-2 subgroup domain-containing protein n=1 Tax=Dichanthelium oligosanthes TaxID=888268 RepID=A0A1E5W5P0_9POAL|nr:hypothetical protein BAE44_0006272 [Dichanthelium oligosanthes]